MTSRRVTNYVFYGLITISILLVALTLVKGRGQDEKFMSDTRLYKTLITMLQREDYQEAEHYAALLMDKYPDSFVSTWNYALSLAGQKRYPEAKMFYIKTLTKRKALLLHPKFLIDYGETLYNLDEFAKSQRYLSRAIELSEDDRQIAKAQDLLNKIEQVKNDDN